MCVFPLEGHFKSISIGHGAFKDPGTELITVPLVALFRKVFKERQLL